MQITRDQYQGWRNNPVTREVFQILNERKENLKNLAISGVLANNAYEYGLIVGRFSEINDLQEMTFDDMEAK